MQQKEYVQEICTGNFSTKYLSREEIIEIFYISNIKLWEEELLKFLLTPSSSEIEIA